MVTRPEVTERDYDAGKEGKEQAHAPMRMICFSFFFSSRLSTPLAVLQSVNSLNIQYLTVGMAL